MWQVTNFEFGAREHLTDDVTSVIARTLFAIVCGRQQNEKKHSHKTELGTVKRSTCTGIMKTLFKILICSVDLRESF